MTTRPKTPLKQRRANAERQRKYREKHLQDEAGTKARLSVIVDYRAALALKRLAKHYGITQAATLNLLLMAEQGRVLDGLDSDGQNAYYDCVTA